MTLSSKSLLERLALLAAAGARPPRRLLVAFSGGLDSTVLLHAVAAADTVPVLAVHINHGLHDDADLWQQHCRATAAAFAVEFKAQGVSVDRSSGQGTEAAAREARYEALRAIMQDGDWLLSAHHRDDQAETLLLNLLRGSGPAGLAGIGEIRTFGAGWLVRPLLPFARSDLQTYAREQELHWIEDSSNSDQNLDRNFLRHDVLPRLRSRWPETTRCLQRSSHIASEAAALLDDLAAMDAQSICDAPRRCDRLRIDALIDLPGARQRNVLRFIVRQLGLPTPSAAQLQQVLDSLLYARPDAEPLVCWRGVEMRRYRKLLYVLRDDVAATPLRVDDFAGRGELRLGAGLGVLRLEAGAATGLSQTLVESGLELRYRQGGEKFRPVGQTHTRTLKNLLQEEGIVPWMRDRIPLLFSGGQLVAVADLWLAADAASKPGVAIHWHNRPSIH